MDVIGRTWIVVLLAGALLLSGVSVRAQELQGSREADWTKAMFDTTSHDFGVVARGAKVEYRFLVKNPYNEDMEIESVRSSCGCSTAEPTKRRLKGAKDYDPAPFDRTEIVVKVDTRGSLGRKDATITVKLRRPSRPPSSSTSTPTSAATWWSSRGSRSSAW